MSLRREYETSKLGPTTIIAFTNVVTRIRLATAAATGFKRRSFAVYVTQDARVLQGNKEVAVTTTTGILLTSSLRWRIDVDSPDDAYISVVRNGSSNGNIELTRISDVDSSDIPAAV